MNHTEQVRIKKGVKPYGGRKATVTGRETYPNGRRVVRVLVGVPTYSAMSLIQPTIREYNEEEIEAIANPRGGVQ